MQSVYKMKLSMLLAMLCFAFTACNKEDQEAPKGIQVVISGYNGSNDPLEVSIDTTVYDQQANNGGFILKPLSMAGFNTVYTFRPGKSPQVLSIKNPATGTVLFSEPLPVTGTQAIFNFVYMDGQVMNIQPPAADPATNKLGFYVRYTDNNEPFDIFLYRQDNTTGEEYRQYLAKNVKPGEWTYVNYEPSPAFATSSLLGNSRVYFTKAGTTDQWAFKESEGYSVLTASELTLPYAGDKGLVQPYFITPGNWALEQSRLFFYPARS